MNPFKFGSVVEGEHFTDRENEVRELIADIAAGQHVIIISQRRLGKSSLVAKALKKAGKPVIQMDLEIITDELDFANTYTKKALSLSSIEKFKRYLKGFKIQPSINFNPANGDFDASFIARADSSATPLLDALELPETIARDQHKHFVVVFDEFQEVRRISQLLERKMRGVFQQHHNVSYIFIGSQESMIRDIFQEKKNPFYKFGRQITLQPISEAHMVAFVRERFTSVGINAEPHISDILKITGYHPYYTQQLCYELYVILQAKKHHQIAKDDIVQAQQTIITQHNVDYRAWWNALNTTDRKIIIGIANGMTEPSSQAFIQKYGIRSTSTAITATNKLIKKGYLIRNSKTGVLAVEDPFWQQWIVASRS